MIASELCGKHMGRDLVTDKRGTEKIVMITHRKTGEVIVRTSYPTSVSRHTGKMMHNTADHRFEPDAQVYVGR
jgi:hypothetical protein